jgi:hypothetical protein
MSSQKQVNKSKFLFGLSRWHLKTTGRAIYRSKVKLEVLNRTDAKNPNKMENVSYRTPNGTRW